MLSDRSWLDAPAIRSLIAAFDAAGLDFRFVGGVVRDALLGRPISDIDVATPALPDEIIRAVEAAGLKAIPTGIAHGTITALIDRRAFEITTLRRDIETDGRHAVVSFTVDWRQDAVRRDFTMNALYADRHGGITDFFGGVADARSGKVRFIGDPDARILEDALRILRFFRFHAWYGLGAIDRDGLAACSRHAVLIDCLSAERIRDELLKLLRAPDPAPVWRAMIDAGIMAQLAPGAIRLDDLGRLSVVERELEIDTDPFRRLAALIGPGGALGGLESRLKLSNKDAEYLESLAAFADRAEWVERGEFARALWGVESRSSLDATLLSLIRHGHPQMPRVSEFQSFISTWRPPPFPVTGKDLAARGVIPGPEMGSWLKQIEEWWLAANLAPGREECLAELDRRLAR